MSLTVQTPFGNAECFKHTFLLAIKILRVIMKINSNFLADLSIRTIFDEEILLENIHFYSFTEESSKRLV